jgi:5-hydroxyisourate hydrolase
MISSHVLDTALGVPARDVTVHLELLEADGQWRRLASGRTNDDGRVSALTGIEGLRGRTCRLSFETGPYLEGLGAAAFFPRIDVVFSVAPDATRYHIPLLLSPYGYTTYRGS